MGLDCPSYMAERERPISSSNSGLEDLVITINGNIPRSRKELRKMGSCPWWELPFHAAMVVTDLEGAVLEQARNLFGDHHNNHEIPQGGGRPVVLETGLLGWKGTLGYMGRRFEENDWKVYYAKFPRLLNWELLEMRADSLLEVTKQANEETGEQAYWGLWSKGVAEGLVECLCHPEEVKKRVRGIAAWGPPLGKLNPVVVRVYSGTQFINRVVFGRDDTDFFAQFGDPLEIRIPEGVSYTQIDIKNKGIIQSKNGDYKETRFVDGTHTAMGSREQVFRKTAESFASS